MDRTTKTMTSQPGDSPGFNSTPQRHLNVTSTSKVQGPLRSPSQRGHIPSLALCNLRDKASFGAAKPPWVQGLQGVP